MHISKRQAQTRRFFLPLVILSFLFLVESSPPAWASVVTARAQAGYPFDTGEVVEVEFPGSASASDNAMNSANGIGYSSTAFASPAMRLSVSATATGYANIAPRYSAGASVTVTDDTTFYYQPDYAGEMDDWVEVGLTGALSGTITGSGQAYCFFGCGPDAPVGGAIVSAVVAITGETYDAHPDEGGQPVSAVFNTGNVGGIVASGETIDVNEFVSTGYVWVPRGTSVGLSVGLSMEVVSSNNPFGTQSSHHGTVEADFSNTFEFDPYEFFDIRTPGVTANSPSLGLVDNQLVAFIDTDPTAVPTPAAWPLMASGLAVFGVFIRRRS